MVIGKLEGGAIRRPRACHPPSTVHVRNHAFDEVCAPKDGVGWPERSGAARAYPEHASKSNGVIT